MPIPLLEDINRTRVLPQLLGEVMELYAEMPREDRDVSETRFRLLLDFLTDKGFTGARHSEGVDGVAFEVLGFARRVLQLAEEALKREDG